MHTHAAPGRDVKRPVRTRRRATGALRERRRPARDSHGAQQVGVQHEFSGAAAVGHCPQCGHGQPMQLGRRRVLLSCQAFSGLQHRTRTGVAAVIADDVGGERVDGLHLGDDVEIAARVQLNVDVRERLQPGPELASGAPHALGHCAHQTVIAGEQCDDPVGLTELVLTQHHRSIPVQPHHMSFSFQTDRSRYAAPIILVPMVGNERFPTLTQQLFQLASGTVTSEQLVRRSLDAITASQPTLNAFRVVLTAQALTDAAEADRKRATGQDLSQHPLLGIPIAVKDDVDVAGVPTRFGTDGDVAPARADSEVVRRLRAAGAVIVGKTNTCELGQWPFTSGPGFGHTRNPWSREHTPGGSSGGSAAAVAAGLVAAAIGSDGAGSVRIPAAWTHLVGIKPQRGRISTWPLPEAFNGITVNGILARTVTDAAVVLDAASGNVEGDLHKPPPVRVSDFVAQAPGPLKIALSTKFPYSVFGAKLHPEIRAAMDAMATQLEELGHTIVAAEPDYNLSMSWSFLSRSTSGLLDWADRLGPGVSLDKRTRANLGTGWVLSQNVLRKARAREADAHRRIGWIFNLVDVVLAPTTAQPPPRANRFDKLSGLATDRAMIQACPVTWPWNLLGWPSINVPAGFTHGGLPIGVQLMGPANSEPLLISLAAELEALNGWATKQPDVWWIPPPAPDPDRTGREEPAVTGVVSDEVA